MNIDNKIKSIYPQWIVNRDGDNDFAFSELEETISIIETNTKYLSNRNNARYYDETEDIMHCTKIYNSIPLKNKITTNYHFFKKNYPLITSDEFRNIYFIDFTHNYDNDTYQFKTKFDFTIYDVILCVYCYRKNIQQSLYSAGYNYKLSQIIQILKNPQKRPTWPTMVQLNTSFHYINPRDFNQWSTLFRVKESFYKYNITGTCNCCGWTVPPAQIYKHSSLELYLCESCIKEIRGKTPRKGGKGPIISTPQGGKPRKY